MKVSLSTHCSEDVLEEYSMGMPSSQDAASVEEHLLVCVACQGRLEKIDEYVRVVKAAAAILNAGPPGRSRRLLSMRSTHEPVYERDLLLCS